MYLKNLKIGFSWIFPDKPSSYYPHDHGNFEVLWAGPAVAAVVGEALFAILCETGAAYSTDLGATAVLGQVRGGAWRSA